MHRLITPTLSAAHAAWLDDTFARNRARFGGLRMEADAGAGGGGGNGGGTDTGGGAGEPGNQDQTFTQADVDKLVGKARTEERRKAGEKYADYDDLKAKAGEKATADERIADLEKKHAAAEARALRADIANLHGISTEDRDLFLTASDEEGLTAQAKRLAAREADRKKNGNHVPREGQSSTATGSDDERTAVRQLFGTGG